MSKFKAGDVVERINVAAYGGLPSGKQGVVSQVIVGGVWIKGYGEWYHVEETLRLVEQDDPLPPAPESVMYIGRQVRTRILRVKTYAVAPGEQVVDLHIGGGILGDGKSCSLDADAALQLAHDLTRMAMEIKRRERAQSGE